MVSLQPGQQEPYHTHGHPMFYYILQVLTSDDDHDYIMMMMMMTPVVTMCLLFTGHSDSEAERDQEPGEEVAVCEYPEPLSSWHLQ